MSKISEIFHGRLKVTVMVILIAVISFLGYRTFTQKSQQPTYQTTQAQKGTLVTNITASGQITTANNIQITIQASGVVKDVLVKNGDSVFL